MNALRRGRGIRSRRSMACHFACIREKRDDQRSFRAVHCRLLGPACNGLHHRHHPQAERNMCWWLQFTNESFATIPLLPPGRQHEAASVSNAEVFPTTRCDADRHGAPPPAPPPPVALYCPNATVVTSSGGQHDMLCLLSRNASRFCEQARSLLTELRMPPRCADNSSRSLLPDPTWRLGIPRASLRATPLSCRTLSVLRHSAATASAAAPAVSAEQDGSAANAAVEAALTPRAADMAARLRVGFRLETERGLGNVRGAQRLSEFATDTFLALLPTQVGCILH